MATGGWGAVGGGAWGTPNSKNYVDDDDLPARQPTHSASGFGTGAFGAAPSPQVDLATTSQRSQAGFANNAGFGSTAGAYGMAAAGGQTSFNYAPAGTSSLNDPALRRKEAELAAKEKQLKELEAKLAGDGGLKKKNWPICYPILYHNIAEEIPERARRIVREGYLAWYGLVICLLWNWFCTCLMLGQQVDQKVASWFLGLLYLLCGIPLSWWLWYKRVYHGARQESTMQFIWFFLWFGVHTAFCIWAAIAIPFSASQWSFAGFATAMKALNVTTFTGIIYLVGAGCWCAEAAWSCWVIMDVFLFFRGKGGIQQAKEEAQREAALSAFRGGAGNQV